MANHGHFFIGAILYVSVSRTIQPQIDIPLLPINPNRLTMQVSRLVSPVR